MEPSPPLSFCSRLQLTERVRFYIAATLASVGCHSELLTILYLQARPERLRRLTLDPRLNPCTAVLRVIKDEPCLHRTPAFRTLKLPIAHRFALQHKSLDRTTASTSTLVGVTTPT